MKFHGKNQFKAAITNYGMDERKEFKFIKDEGDRVRAKCTWAKYPWVCLCKKTSRLRAVRSRLLKMIFFVIKGEIVL